MDENLKQINEAIVKLYERFDEVGPGTEEQQILVESIKSLEQTRNEMLKTDSELSGKDTQMTFNKTDLVIKALGLVAVPLIGLTFQLITNNKLFEFEKTDVMSHKGWDNNVMKFFKK